MDYNQAVELFWNKLGNYKIMALASCVDNKPSIRNISAIFYNDAIYFKTDINFKKTQQLMANPQVALAFHGVQVEGIAENSGLVVDEPGRVFEAKYKEYLWGSYNKYSHEDTEVLIKVTPTFVEIWDDDENQNAYQLFIDFVNKTVEKVNYD